MFKSNKLKLKVKFSDIFKEKLITINNTIRNNEWSGVSFYNIDLKRNIINMEVLDFIPISEGTVTSFKGNYLNPKITDYQMKYMEAMEGLIHKHPNDVFISGTDRDEIEEKLKNDFYKNGYLSIVVNVYGDVLLSFNIKTKSQTTHTFVLNSKEVKIKEEIDDYISFERIFNLHKENAEVLEEIVEMEKYKVEPEKSRKALWEDDWGYNNNKFKQFQK